MPHQTGSRHESGRKNPRAEVSTKPVITRRWPNVDLLLVHRLRRRTKSKSTLCQRFMFAVKWHAGTIPVNRQQWPNAGVILGQSLRRWTHIISHWDSVLCLLRCRSIWKVLIGVLHYQLFLFFLSYFKVVYGFKICNCSSVVIDCSSWCLKCLC